MPRTHLPLRAALARACELGVAMQLTSIARDVGEDARNGRLYLPRAWMREAGIDPDAWLAAPRFDAAIGQVIQRLLDAADEEQEHGIHRDADLGARLHGLVGTAGSTLPHGNGRSYGDSCLADSGHVLHMRGLDRVIEADWESGRIVVEAGANVVAACFIIDLPELGGADKLRKLDVPLRFAAPTSFHTPVLRAQRSAITTVYNTTFVSGTGRNAHRS